VHAHANLDASENLSQRQFIVYNWKCQEVLAPSFSCCRPFDLIGNGDLLSLVVELLLDIYGHFMDHRRAPSISVCPACFFL